jgi:hypothetical protein
MSNSFWGTNLFEIRMSGILIPTVDHFEHSKFGLSYKCQYGHGLIIAKLMTGLQMTELVF